MNTPQARRFRSTASDVTRQMEALYAPADESDGLTVEQAMRELAAVDQLDAALAWAAAEVERYQLGMKIARRALAEVLAKHRDTEQQG
jgi:hypothetical protein